LSDPASDPQILALLPIAELRERAQSPMRRHNDIGGVLFGDWVSPYITREFLRYGWSPTIGTMGMLVAGLCGAVMMPFGGIWSVLGALCFILFYVLDCVDGEVARLRGIDSYYWTFPDFFIGAGIMSLFYISLGIHAMLLTGSPWLLLAGTALAMALLIKKLLDACHLFLAMIHIASANAEQQRRYMAELGLVASMPDAVRTSRQVSPASAADVPLQRSDVVLAYGSSWPGVLRGIMTNFHLAMLAFTVAAFADLAFGPWHVLHSKVDLKTIFLVAYVPIYIGHVADHLVSLARGLFLTRSAAGLRLLLRQGWSPDRSSA
jgi:hypothetical protein